MLSPNAIRVLEKRYLIRNESGQAQESPEGLFRRVAQAVAAVEPRWGADEKEQARVAESFYEDMLSGAFLPNSPTLMNAGKERGQLSACFVLPVPDSLEGIFETCKNAALIHKTGGGTGFSFSRLRPANDRVATTTGVASGPVSFMTVYDAATEAIRQGGTRRGANMGILNIDHPDIEEFIACKSDTTKLNNFNISVGISEAFMQAVEEDAQFQLVHPRTREPVRAVNARHLFEKIVANAHATAEPGIVFLDRINNADPMMESIGGDGLVVPGTEDIEATNPCGEQPLGPGDACNLGSINVSRFIDRTNARIDWKALAEMVARAVRFLDDIVEANNYPLPFIARAALGNRRIGLGLMGWAEALIMLDIAYDSKEAIELAETLMKFVQEHAHDASRQLASVRGTFPNWEFSRWGKDNVPMRNATVTTIAPTGTISIIAGTSSGIEPLFAVSFVRRVMGGVELIEVNQLFEAVARERGFYSDDLMQRIAHEGTIQAVDGIPSDVKRIFKCAHDISFDWHLKMQAAFQRHTDCAVSKTINFPAHATVDDVRAAYLDAYRLGLKGLTVYRDTSRQSQVLNIGRTDPLKKAASAGLAGTATSPRRKRAGGSKALRLLTVLGEDKFKPGVDCGREQTPTRSAGRQARACPECGSGSESSLRYEACRMCRSCGYTRC